MESPPSSSTWSEAFILSEDSGLLLTCGSVSSGSMSGDSSGFPSRLPLEIQDSDCEGKSLSQDDSPDDDTTDIMCGDNFNTLKKGPHWTTDLLPPLSKYSAPIDPPPEFQDAPSIVEFFADRVVVEIVSAAFREFVECRVKVHRPLHHLLTKTYWKSDFLSYSPCHGGRPNSRSSLGSSRLSSSHNSLSVPAARRADDSTFITQAVSHDALLPSDRRISDIYNVPFDSDVYAVPVDVIRPQRLSQQQQQQARKMQPVRRKRRNTASGCRIGCKKGSIRCEQAQECGGKRHSVAGSSTPRGEPIHMTLHEVRQYLQTLYSSSSDSSDQKENMTETVFSNNNVNSDLVLSASRSKTKRNPFFINIKNKKIKDSCDSKHLPNSNKNKENKNNTRFLSLKQTLCSMFRFRSLVSPDRKKKTDAMKVTEEEARSMLVNRALPPLPPKNAVVKSVEEQTSDFATSIHKVKDYGWYWGPLSSEAAEKILSNEPDGSFIVRDSSDDHYIFSLTFKLNQCIRHVRIEHDQGNFSFGSCTKFKSRTIVEFIENAVEHSRSGRYLFFLHRRPAIGPIRVQLLHPVSRFKQIQSLQHMCRFVILKAVRRDLISSLPLPRRMIDYLNTPHYYSEHLVDVEDNEEIESSRSDDVSSRNAQVPIETVMNPFGVVNNYVLIENNAEISRQS